MSKKLQKEIAKAFINQSIKSHKKELNALVFLLPFQVSIYNHYIFLKQLSLASCHN